MNLQEYNISEIPENDRNLLLQLTGVDVLNNWEIVIRKKEQFDIYVVVATMASSFVKILIDLESRSIVNSAFHFNADQEHLIADLLKTQKLRAAELATRNVIFCYKNKLGKHPVYNTEIRLTGYDTFGKYDCKMFQNGDVDHFRSVMCDCGSEIFEEIAWIYDANRPNYQSARAAWIELGKEWVGQIHQSN